MAQYDQIQAKIYNDIRKKINSVLGTGSNIYGYGQALQSTDVKAGMQIERAHLESLRYDVNRCIRHQQGEDTTYLDIEEITRGEVITWEQIVGFDLMADTAILGRDSVYEGSTAGGKTQQVETISGGYRTLHAGWGSNESGQRYGQQTYNIKWDNANAARYFFNAGGYLRLVCSTSGTASNTKSVGWQSIVGHLHDSEFTFNFNNYRDAITGNQTEFRTQIFDSTNPYTENYAFASFTLVNPRTIRVLIQFVDNDTGDHNPATDVGLGPFGHAVDETVTIDINAGLEYRTTLDAVTVNNPQFTIPNFTLPENTTFQTFDSYGIHKFTVPAGTTSIEVLAVGGGGGGAFPESGYTGGGGGGSGQSKYTTLLVTPLETIDIYVGKGGSAGYTNNGTVFKPGDGEDTTIRSIIGGVLLSKGGAGGKGNWGGISGSGRAGGVPGRYQSSGAGGGGTGAAGERTHGGAGTNYSLVSTNVAVGGGGGGGDGDPSSAASYGGFGGGGDGATSANSFTPGNGVDGTGGGGGGGQAAPAVGGDPGGASTNNQGSTPSTKDEGVVYAGKGGCGLVVIFC